MTLPHSANESGGATEARPWAWRTRSPRSRTSARPRYCPSARARRARGFNVVLDFVLDRPPFAEAAAALWAAAKRKEIEVLVRAHGVTTVFLIWPPARGAPRMYAAWERPTHRPGRRCRGRGHPSAGAGARTARLRRCGLRCPGRSCAARYPRDRDSKGYPDPPVLVADPSTAVSLFDGSPSPEGLLIDRPPLMPALRRCGRAHGGEQVEDTGLVG
jgi:hypothetical protein